LTDLALGMPIMSQETLAEESGKEITVRKILPEDKRAIVSILRTCWDSELVTSRGNVYDASTLPGFVAIDRNKSIQGLVTLSISGGSCEIVTIDALQQGVGIGSLLFDSVVQFCRENEVTSLWLVTTNDNLNALKFYQKRGMRMSKLYPGAIDFARANLKPQIPALGQNGIPLRDEITLELTII